MNVLLEDGTVGNTSFPVEVGDRVAVDLHDENGNPITVEGVVKEILD